MPDLALATHPECYEIQTCLYLLISLVFPFPYAHMAGIRRMPHEVRVPALGTVHGLYQNDYQMAGVKIAVVTTYGVLCVDYNCGIRMKLKFTLLQF